MKFFKSSIGNSYLLLLSLLLVLMINNELFGQSIIFVNAGAGSGGNGASWGTAYNSLTTAIGQSYTGVQIWVAKGTYYPNDRGPGRASTFQVPYGVSLYGGFAGNENDTTQRVNYGHGEANETILSGDAGTGNSADNYYTVVTFADGVDNTSIFSGFTITKGNSNAYDIGGNNYEEYNEGGGIFNYGSPVIENCTIIENNADFLGGGVENTEITGTIVHRAPIFINDIISGNTANTSGDGGGIDNSQYQDSYLEPVFVNCIISGNYSGNVGGGVKNYYDPNSTSGDCNPKFINCTFSGNNSPNGPGGAIFNDGTGCAPTIKNCILWNNSDEVGNLNGLPTFSYSLIELSGGSGVNWDNTLGTDGGNNIDVDPSFTTPLDPTTAPSIAGDFHLQGFSPAMDAGTPPAQAPSYDLEGRSRPLPNTDSYVDMGAYEEYSDGTFPVELTAFSASVNGQSVELDWKTATEVNNFGFKVERLSKSLNNSWKKIGFVKGHGNSNSPKQYSFTDNNPGTGKIEYRLKQIDNDGKFNYSKTVEVALYKPTKFALEQNYPNPFNPTTNIGFRISHFGFVSLKIYDALGREVATLVNGFKNPGSYTIQWNADRFASGIYYYRITAIPNDRNAGKFTQAKKMILIK